MRDELWARAVKKSEQSGAILQIWTDQNPQGFSYRQLGESNREFIDFEGMSLIKLERTDCSQNDKDSDTVDH